LLVECERWTKGSLWPHGLVCQYKTGQARLCPFDTAQGYGEAGKEEVLGF